MGDVGAGDAGGSGTGGCGHMAGAAEGSAIRLEEKVVALAEQQTVGVVGGSPGPAEDRGRFVKALSMTLRGDS